MTNKKIFYVSTRQIRKINIWQVLQDKTHVKILHKKLCGGFTNYLYEYFIMKSLLDSEYSCRLNILHIFLGTSTKLPLLFSEIHNILVHLVDIKIRVIL